MTKSFGGCQENRWNALILDILLAALPSLMLPKEPEVTSYAGPANKSYANRRLAA